MKKHLFLVFVLISLIAPLQAQVGTIKGIIRDTEANEALSGATVRLLLDSTVVGGAYSEDDGSYSIQAKPGTYTIRVSYISYASQTIDAVTVKAGETVTRDISLGLDIQKTGDENTVVITDKVIKNTEASLINIQRRSTSVVDVISLEQVKRAGDGDAGSAMKRVTGVTVEGGKYVYVRGLGDRYSKTLLNGAEIPGLDPNRNSVQMDMFPSSLIDNLIVHKTFSPELPGSFTGGLVKITTKDFPQAFTFSAGSSLGYNTTASLRSDFLSGTRGKLDWLGMDDGTRALSAPLSNSGYIVPDISFADPVKATAIDNATKSFTTPIYPEATNSGLNHSHNITIGNQKPLAGRPFGYIASLTYSDTKTVYGDYEQGRWVLSDNVDRTTQLTPQVTLAGTNSIREILWGGLVNLSYLPALNHQFSFNYMHNQAGTSNASYLIGGLQKDDPNLVFETRVLGYTQRAMDAFQLKADHKFGILKADWIASYTRSSQDEPDLRFFSNDFTRDDSLYDIQRNLYAAPSRYFRKMSENNLDAKANFSLPFTQWNDLNAFIRFGGAYTYKDRKFFERRFEYVNGNSNLNYNGNPSEYFDPANLGVLGTDANGLYQYGLYITDATELRNSYIGEQGVLAAYAMTELPLTTHLRFVGGARMEKTDILLVSKDPGVEQGQLNNLDILPSANLIYSLRQEAAKNIMNLRASYARTLARPVFRELAPYASFDFIGDITLIGNPNLQRTLVDNFDLRWELFPTSAELVSVSAFYKDFTLPIELVINPLAANLEGNYRNVDRAQLFGFEFEFRKQLGFITPTLKNFRAGGNVTLIRSFQTIAADELEQIRALNPYAEATRQMFGQSPYTINGDIAYINDTLGFTVSVNYNVFGPRISAVSRGGTPNVYEMARPSLDVSLSKDLSKNWSLTLRGRNLFDPEYRRVHRFADKEFVYSNYRIGRTVTLGLSYTFN
jgi:outer membrane receptor for ferrienterochelin and colicin